MIIYEQENLPYTRGRSDAQQNSLPGYIQSQAQLSEI